MQRVLYKLTTSDHKTRKGEYNETKWGPGVTHTAPGNGSLCSPAYIHAYTTPLLAVLLNSIHANLANPVLWRCVGKVEASDGLKAGCTILKTVKEISLPEITTTQRVAFAILVALNCYKDKGFARWARAWLRGEDRSYAAHAAHAAAAAHAAVAAANAARAVSKTLAKLARQALTY